MINKEIESIKEKVLEDISKLVAINSVRDLKSKEENAPFGLGIRKAMDEFTTIAENLGFNVVDHGGYAISAQMGNQDDHIGILAHIDVVEAEENDWLSDPFTMDVREGYIYGRGVNDDKGPLVAALYAAKLAYESVENPKHAVRVIVGGAEETTWECMDHYFAHNPQPVYGFSPDGNFPIVNGEMGVFQISLNFEEEVVEEYSSQPRLNFLCHELDVNGKQYIGDKHLSRNPQRGKNAIDAFFDQGEFSKTRVNQFINTYLHNDYKGQKLDLAVSHESMNDLSVCMMSLNSHKTGYELCLDVRYPISISSATIINKFKSLESENGFKGEVIKIMEPLFVDEKSDLIKSLQSAYSQVMGEKADTLTKGGASYARVLDRGVAFGATFEGEDPRPHMSNETMPISSLFKALEIYVVAIKNLIK